MMILKLYVQGEVAHEEPLDFTGKVLIEQREAYVERRKQWIRDHYSRGLSVTKKWEMRLEVGSRMNEPDFNENQLPTPPDDWLTLSINAANRSKPAHFF